MQFETDRGALGSAVISQLSAGRKNRLWLEVDGAEESLGVRPGRAGEPVVWPPRVRHDPQAGPGVPVRAGRPPGVAAGRPRAGLWGLLRRVRGRRVRRDPRRRSVDGLPAFADGLRTAVITDAVLAAAREERWIDVPAHEPLEVAT